MRNLPFPSAQQLSRNIPEDEGCLCQNAAVLRDKKKRHCHSAVVCCIREQNVVIVVNNICCLNKGRPTWWHSLYYVNLLLNMFRMLIHPSSGACDYLVCYCVGCIVLTWGVLVLCSGIDCWWCGIRVQAEPLLFVVQPALGYHITNSQSRYITPTRLKSAKYSLHNNAPSSRKLLRWMY